MRGDAMKSTELDVWPLPKFHAGDAKHLHAVGVISLTFVQFERGVEGLFLHHPSQEVMPRDLVYRYFYALSEEQRLKAIRAYYKDHEEDEIVRSAVGKVLELFDWAHDARNKILHSELYPPGLAGRRDTFYLIKRAGKREPGSIYLAFTLPELRGVAERMREGVVAAAEIHMHLRYRETDPSHLPESVRVYAARPPSFRTLEIPNMLKATEAP